jgi:hypothetical protein
MASGSWIWASELIDVKTDGDSTDIQHILLEKLLARATHWQGIRIPARSTMCAVEEIKAFGDMSVQWPRDSKT